MAKPPIKTKSPATPSWAGLMFTGKPAQSSTIASANGDDGKNDVGLVAGMDQNEVRAANQTTGEKVKNGLVKLGGTAVTSFVEPIADILVGLPTAAFGGGDAGERTRAVYDNVGTQALDSLNEYLQKEYPHYYSQKEQNMSLAGQLGTANFWADKVGNGAGFMLGAIASGALGGEVFDALKAAKMAKGVATAAELANDVRNATKEGSAILGAVESAATKTVSSAAKRNLFTGTIGALGESGMEGRQIAKDTGIAVRKQLVADAGGDPNAYEDFAFTPAQEAHIKDLEEAAGNVGFGVNMLLTGTSNALLLPKVFRKGYEAERVALGAIEGSFDAGYKMVEQSAKKKALRTLGKVALNNLEEATQEQLQYAVEQGLPDYFKKQRDPKATTDFNDAIASTVMGLQEAYGTKAGWENALLGGIIGLAGAHTSLGEVNAETRATQAAVDNMNGHLAGKSQQAMIKALVAQRAYADDQDDAVAQGKRKEATDAAFGGFSAMVRGFSQAGKIEDLKEALRKSGELTPEEFKEANQLGADAELKQSPAQMAADQIQKAEALHKLSQHVEAAYPGDKLIGLRDAFYGIAAQVQNSESRERKMVGELAKDTGISLDALKLLGTDDSYKTFKDAVEKWANEPGRIGLLADSAMEKANDVLKLSEERIQLANMYKMLEDPKHREQVFAAQEKLKTVVQAQQQKEEEDKVAAKAATASTAPVGATEPADTDGFDDDEEEANTGAFGKSLTGGAVASTAPAGETPHVNMGGGMVAFATLNPDGTVAKYTQVDSLGGKTDYLPDSNGFKFAHGNSLMQAAVAKAQAAQAAPAPAPAGPAAAVAVVQTDVQKATIASIEKLKETDAKLKDDGSKYATLTDEYDRASGLKKTLLSPRTNVGLSAEDVAASEAWLKENRQYADRGNIADLIIREYFLNNGVLSLEGAHAVADQYAAEQKAKGVDIWERLEITDGFVQGVLDSVTALKTKTDSLGLVVLSDVATLYGEIDGKKTAGTTDLVAVQPDGSIVIIDVKSNETSRRADYLKKDVGLGTDIRQGTRGKYVGDESSNREGDLIQQATYEELLKQRVPGLVVAGRYIFPIVTKDGNNASTTGKAIYTTAVVEQSIGKPGLEGLCINLNKQTTVGRSNSINLGNFSIADLIRYYKGAPAANSGANQAVVYYASATETGELEQKKHMATAPIGNMPLLVSVVGDTATASLSPAAQDDLQKNGTSGLDKFFEGTPLPIPNRGKFTYEVVEPVKLALENGVWKVQSKGRIILQYADGTTSDTKVEPSKKEGKPPVGPNTFSRLQGGVASDWVGMSKGEVDKQLAIHAEWTEALASSPAQRAEPVVVRVEDKQLNVYTKVAGKELKVGYLASTSMGTRATDSEAVIAAYNAAVSLNETVRSIGGEVPIQLRITSMIDSAADVRTDKPLSELDSRFMIDGSYQVIEIHGQYRGEGSTSFSNALTGGAVKRNTAEELENAKAGGITSRYAMRVQAPGGEVRIIGVNAALLTDEKVYANVQEILASQKLTEKEKAKQLNELMFLSHVGPFDKGRPGIKFIGTDKGTVSLLVYRAGEVGADGNSVDTVEGHLRFTAKAQGNTATDFLNTLAYFPLNAKEGLPATTVVGAVRQNILESDTPAQRLQKLVPSTSEKLWRDITPHPELVTGTVDAPSVAADKVAEAAAIATPVAAPATAAPKVAKEGRFTKKINPTVPKKHLARTAEVLESDEFATVAAYVEKNLPTGPNGFNIKEFTAQVLEGGVTVGYVMDMGIRLAKGAPKGTGYHEAFHAVFRTLLNEQERNKYYALARRNTDLSDKAKNKFRKLHPDYAGMSDARLEAEMLEETMADLFSLNVQGKSVPMATLFDKIKAFLKWLLLGGERPVHSELRDLFAKIDNQGFKNSTYRDVNSLSGQSAKKTLEYMNAYDSERAVRILTGDYMRLRSQMGDTMTPDEILEDVLDTRKLELSKPSSWVSGDEEAQEAFLNERNYYKATEEELLFGEVPGKLYPISLAYDADRQTLKQEIRRLEKKLSRSEYVDEEVDELSDDVIGNDQDNASERSYDQGLLEVQNMPGKEIKTFILLATYEDAEGVRQPVDYQNTVDLLTRVLDNTRSFEDMLRKMVKLVAGGNQPQMASVLDNIYTKLSTEDAPFFQSQFRKAFNTIYADPRVTTINAETGEVIRFDANRESVELSLVAKWREGVERVAANKDTLRKAATAFNKLRQTVAAPDSTPAERAADEIAIIEALGTMGFDMSVGLLHNAISGDDDYYSWKKTAGKESIEADLQQIVDTLFNAVENPFKRKSDDATTLEKANLKAGEGAVARALRLATADIRYRQDVQEASGQDAAQKPYHARTQPSFVLERGRDIQDGTYSFDKPWLKHNLVVRYENAGATVRPLLKLKADLGIRENKTDEGLTPKGMDPKTYWLANTSAFRNVKGETKEREIFPFQLEAKSSAVSVNIPVYAPGQYVANGELTDTALQDLHFMALQDLQNGEDAIVDLYPTLEYAYTAGPILPPIEGTHFLKKAANGLPGGYDENGNPILIPLEQIRQYQNSGNRKYLPRIFQVVSMPHLNELTNDQLRDRKYVDMIHKGEEAMDAENPGRASFNHTLVEAAKKQLSEVGLDVGNSANVKLLMGTNSGYKTIDDFLGDFVLTNLLWSDAYLRLQVGSEAWFKDHVDATKRMALLIAAGPNMGKGSHRFAALETHDSFLDAKTLLPITEAQYKAGVAADKANGTTTVRKADSTDAQVYWTADMAKKFYMGIGKLTKKTAALYDKAIAGETLTQTEQKLLLDEGVSLISAKGVYASQLTDGSIVYLKFSAHILTKELTSFKDKDGNWHAKADMEAGHNMRLWMENNKLDAAGHDTSFKVGLRNKNFRDKSGNYSGEAGYVDLPNNGLREQMQNPSGKRKIVYPTQVLQLLDEGMQDDETVEYQGNEVTIAELRDQYQDDFRSIRKTLMQDAEIATRAVVEGNRLLVGQIISTLEASGASPVELAFFQQSETEADFLHSTDLPAVNKRFQKLFLAHYNKGALSLKAPGSKYTLVTSGNTRVVVGPDGSLAHDWSKDYADQDYWTPDFKLKEGYTTRELHMHGPESAEPGSPVRLAEVYLSEELLLRAGDNGMTLKELYSLDEETRNQIITQMGVRIPFQSHHSAMPFKVVGWVPAHYGSVVIAPAAITTLSGADYDIDSLYVLRKEFWQSADGNWHVYGEGLADSVSRKRFNARLEENFKLSLKKPALSEEDKVRYAEFVEAAEVDYPKFRAADVAHHRWEEYEASKHSDKTLKAAENAAKQSAAYQEATQTILEAGKFLVNRKKKSLGAIRETQNEVEPILRTIRSILLATEDRTLAQERALAQATDKLIDLSVGQTLIANKIAAAKKVQENILHEAHKMLGVATTQSEFEKLSRGKQVSNYATYSSIMDANLALITNPANAESIVTPAEVQPLQDIVDNFSYHRPKGDEDKLPYSSVIVRSSHQFNNLVGKANIGPAALANTVSSLLTKHRYDFEMPFYFMGAPMKGYARNLEDDITIAEDGKVTIVKNSGRKANSLSTLVSAMADNAKERLAAKLNLTKDNLMALANLVAMGYGLQRTMLFAAQPAMDILSQRYRATQSVVDKNTSQLDVLAKLVDDIKKRIKSGVPLPGEGLAAPKQKKKAQVVAEVALSLKDLRRELTRAIHPDKADSENADQVAQFTEITQRVNAAYDAKDLRQLVSILEEVRKIEGVNVAVEGSYEEILGEVDERKITAEEIGDALESQVQDLSLDLAGALASKGPLTEEVYQGLARQKDILMEFAALLEQTKYFKAVSTTLSGNKGVGSDFTGIAKIKRARQKLTVPQGVDKNGDVLTFPAEGGIYLDSILEKEHGLQQNLDNIDALEGTLPENFLSRTSVVQNIVGTIEGMMPGAKEEDLLAAELDAATFLGINGYQKDGVGGNNEYRLANYNHLLLSAEKNLGKQYEELLALADTQPILYGWLKKNAFLRAVSIRTPEKGGTYGLSFNTRQKVSPEFGAKLDEAVRELMSPAALPARHFVQAAVRYLAVKDNFQYKNGSFVSLIPEIQFREFSNELKAIHKAILGNQEDVKYLTGYDVQGVRRQFLYTWFTNPTYRKRVLGLNGKPGNDTKYGELSNAFVKNSQGLYHIDVMTLPEGMKVHAYGLKSFPSIVAIKQSQSENAKILMVHSFPRDKAGQVIRGQAFYEEIPELSWKDRAYYHLNKVEVQQEAARQQQAIADKNSAEAKEDLGVTDTPAEYTDDLGVVPDVTASDYVEDQPAEYVDEVGVPDGLVDTEEDDEDGDSGMGGAFGAFMEAQVADVSMTPYVKELLANWEAMIKPEYHSLTTSQKIKLAKGIEDGSITTSCLL